MPSLKRPGVYAEEILLNPQSSLGGTGVVVTAAFVGTNGRGPTVPTFLSTWSEYVALFGPFTAAYALPHALFQYFANGGQGVWVTRVAGVGAVSATRTLLDRGGSPAATLSITALSPGAWGNSIFYEITDYGVSGTNRWSLTVHYGDSTAATVVERFTDLSMDPTDARYFLNVVNSNSKYVSVTNLFSSNSLAASVPALQSGGSAVLASGADGTAAGTTEYQAAVVLQDQVTDPIVLNLPGVVDTTTLTAAINYAANRGDVFVVLDTASGLTSATALSSIASLPTSGYAAAYWPWVRVNDPSSATPGITRLVPPGGAVVGQYITTDVSRGVWKAPAGQANRIAGAIALETKLTNNDLDLLNTGTPPVNAIRLIPGQGPTIMGARTLDPTSANVYVPNRRTVIYLKAALKNLMIPAIFEPNDQNLWLKITNDLTKFLMDIWQEGGLLGAVPANAFYVKCDETINTPAVVQSGQVIAEVGVATVTPAEFVVLRIGQTNGGAAGVDNS